MEILFFIGKELARNLQDKKKVFSYFDFSTTVTHETYIIFKLMMGFILM